MKLPLYIKAASDLFSNPAYRPVASAPKSDPFGKPEYQPAPPPPRPSSMPNGSRNYLQEGVNAATKKVMQPMHQQMNDIARFGTYGLDAELEFDAQGKPVATAKPLQHAPGTPQFANAFKAWKAKQPADATAQPNVLDQQFFPDDPATWLRMHQRNPRLAWYMANAPDAVSAMAQGAEHGRNTLVNAARTVPIPSYAKDLQEFMRPAPDPTTKPTAQTVLDHIKWMANVNAQHSSVLPDEPPMTDHERRVIDAARLQDSIGYRPYALSKAMKERAQNIVDAGHELPLDVYKGMRNDWEIVLEGPSMKDLARVVIPTGKPPTDADAAIMDKYTPLDSLFPIYTQGFNRAGVNFDGFSAIDAERDRTRLRDIRQQPGYKYLTADPTDYERLSTRRVHPSEQHAPPP